MVAFFVITTFTATKKGSHLAASIILSIVIEFELTLVFVYDKSMSLR